MIEAEAGSGTVRSTARLLGWHVGDPVVIITYARDDEEIAALPVVVRSTRATGCATDGGNLLDWSLLRATFVRGETPRAYATSMAPRGCTGGRNRTVSGGYFARARPAVGLQRQRWRQAARRADVSLITVFGAGQSSPIRRLGPRRGHAPAVVAVLTFPRLIQCAKNPDRVLPPVAVLLMFGVGALATVGVAAADCHRRRRDPSVQTGDTSPRRSGDLKAIMQFVLITCIILPILPNQAYGPFEVFNPWKTWLMVVLIVGMSLGGYIA